MNFDKSWDVEKYKLSHENEEHWNLKKKFLIAHKDKFSEEKLICLAQVFINVKFLGCKYPKPTMHLIRSLAAGLVDTYKEKQKYKLQHTFVKASIDAEAKAEGNCEMAVPLNNNEKSPEKFNYSSPYHPDYILPGFILLMKNGKNINEVLQNSCCQSGAFEITVKFDKQEPNKIICNFFIQNKFIASGFGNNEKFARKDAMINCYMKLQRHCFVIIEKDDEFPDTINKNDIIKSKKVSSVNNSKPSTSCATNEFTLPEDNIGNKLLRNMGWKIGSGLGKNCQGRTEPITVVQLPKNMGFGNNNEISTNNIKRKTISALRNEVNKHLKEFIDGPKNRLTFSTDFTKDERKLIHMLCLKVGLKTKSYGVDACRHIVISKKKTTSEIFQELMENETHENDYYKLIAPDECKNIDVSTNDK